MKVVAFIEEGAVIRGILSHLRLWEEPEPRPPPAAEMPVPMETEYVPCFESPIRRGGGVVRLFPLLESRGRARIPSMTARRLTMLSRAE